MKNNLFRIALILIFAVSTANASSTYWLGTKAQADGSLQSQTVAPIATDFQATATSVETFLYFGQNSSVHVTNGLDYLLANHNNSTEQLARVIQIQAQVSIINQIFVDELLNRVNTDGGMGEDKDFSSNVLDTAWALLAFSTIDNIDQQLLENMIVFIKSKVNTDGGYSNFESNESSIYASSIVNLAFNKYKNTLTFLIDDINNLSEFIVTKQSIEGGWNELYETAIALIALSKSEYIPSTYWLSVLHLRSAKASSSYYNSQWLEEVYTTAIALIAEDLTSGMSEPTTSGSVIGHITDSSTLHALNGAKITLDGLTYKVDYADSLGIFNFSSITNAVHSLEITYPGYISETISFEIVGGDNLNIGEIQLIKNPNTGIIKGIATDGDTDQPYPGVLISVNADTTIYHLY